MGRVHSLYFLRTLGSICCVQFPCYLWLPCHLLYYFGHKGWSLVRPNSNWNPKMGNNFSQEDSSHLLGSFIAGGGRFCPPREGAHSHQQVPTPTDMRQLSKIYCYVFKGSASCALNLRGAFLVLVSGCSGHRLHISRTQPEQCWLTLEPRSACLGKDSKKV